MSNNIYSDLWGEVLTTDLKGIRVYLYDSNGDRYRPNLILSNLLSVRSLRDYLNDVLDKHWDEKWTDSCGSK